ncbi:MAG TPA: ABC transporter permease [Longimicrobiaceae bacterium]|nr:ABC transporter permease [Longimicrobiaceae bacterium]
MRWTNRWRKRLRTITHPDEVERELDDELAFHVEMEIEKNLRAGMSADEARRQAALRFGGVQKFCEEVREARFFGWLDGFSLDARLGLRMLKKYPGLTIIGGLGMAVAIAMAAIFDASLGVANAPLPFEGGDRVVSLEVWDARINNQTGQILHDYGVWEDELRTIDVLGAFRTASRNLIVPGGSAEPTRLAEITASGFSMQPAPPILGRPLVEADEIEGAPAVAVIGHDLWQSRFGGDPEVIGTEVRLGSVVHEIVGVMPEGFGFPLNHQLWVPLRLDPTDHAPGDGPVIAAFGRLAPGATLEEAQAEVTAVGSRLATAFPDSHAQLRPKVVQYGPHLMDDMQGWEIPAMRGMIALLLIIIAVNVAVLVFARTATRAGELTVRSALGASRRRIVTQFFTEGLVLSALSAVLGLAIAAFAVGRIESVMDDVLGPMGGLPYWLDFSLSPRAVAFAITLATLAAVIVGILPALRMTGSRLESALRALGGATGMQLGRTWSILIVAQVAFTVAILPATLFFMYDFARYGMVDPGFAAHEYLTGYIVNDREVQGQDVMMRDVEEGVFRAAYAGRLEELGRRLESEPEVLGATFTVARAADEPTIRFEVEGPTVVSESVAAEQAYPVKYNRVDESFFETFRLPLLAGRAFQAGDESPAAVNVVVNRAFVRDVLGGGRALGRRIRFASGYRDGGRERTPDGLVGDRWYEIVGVVGDLPPVSMEPGEPIARVYRPLEHGSAYPLYLAVRTRGEPAVFAPRLRDLAAAVDPALQTRNLQPLDAVLRKLQEAMRLGALGLGLLIGSVLLLSAAGIYALMSFTVTQRRREIGIRSALGADPRRILASVFARAGRQLGVGAGVGLAVAIGLDVLSGGEVTGGRGMIVMSVVALVILGVGMLATWGPARRGLRIQPMQALREE